MGEVGGWGGSASLRATSKPGDVVFCLKIRRGGEGYTKAKQAAASSAWLAASEGQ